MNKNANKLKELLGMPMDMSKSIKPVKEVKKKTSKKVKKKGSVKC